MKGKRLIALLLTWTLVFTMSFSGYAGIAAIPQAYAAETEMTILPVAEEVTTSSVKLKYFEGYEYSNGGDRWQDSPVFDGLQSNVTYVFYQREISIDGVNPGVSSEGLEVRTLKPAADKPDPPVLESREDTRILLKYTKGYEYSLDGITWTTVRVFSDLTPATTYSFYQRVAETSYKSASEASNPTYISTKSSGAAGKEPVVERITETSITLLDYSDVEFSLDGENWQDSNTFDNLEPDVTYTIYQRGKGNTNRQPGEITSKTVTTAKAKGIPSGYTGIYTKADLDKVRNNLSGKYILMADIYFSTDDFQPGGAYYRDGLGWDPIGQGKSFSGIFNGNGHIISGIRLFYNGTTSSYAGLFGKNEGTIRNLGVIDQQISNIVTMGSSHGFAYTGGIVGFNAGLISNCYHSGTVEGGQGSSYTNLYVGGIAGFSNGGKIENCYNTGTVKGVPVSSSSLIDVGGIAGTGDDTIRCCYNAGDVIVTDWASYRALAGGISRNNSNPQCYSSTETFKNKSLYDTVAEKSTYLTVQEMKNPAKYVGFDFDAVWEMNAEEGYLYPQLRKVSHVEAAENKKEFAGGNGSKENPYLIENAEQLNRIRDYRGANFKLTDDIQLEAGETGVSNWVPIGEDVFHGFFGTIDGNGHVIRGLYIYEEADSPKALGLFGVLNGKVENLGVIDGSITNYLEGDATKTVYNYIGGIAGLTTGRIQYCYSGLDLTFHTKHEKAKVTSYMGGMTGALKQGNITYCYNTGTLYNYSSGGTNSSAVGGICSVVYSGNVLECYNVGLLREVGRSTKSTVEGVSPHTDGICYSRQIENVYLKTEKTKYLQEADLKKAESFAGFDFDSVWFMNEATAYPYPELRRVVHKEDQKVDKSLDGIGTAYDPYLIKNKEQLSFLELYPGKWYRLTKDIDFGGATQNLFCNGEKFTFTGVLDGQNHVLRNVTITSEDSHGSFGFFGMLAGEIHNLQFENIDVVVEQGTTSVYAGVIAGKSYCGSALKNCSVKNGQLLMQGTAAYGQKSYIGGITGGLDGLIYRCAVESDLKYVYTGVSANVGGITGISGGTIKESYFAGSFTCQGGESSSRYGGLTGKNSGTIEDCFHYGDMEMDAGAVCVGGITGENTAAGRIKQVYHVGTLTKDYREVLAPILATGRDDLVTHAYYLDNQKYDAIYDAISMTKEQMRKAGNYGGFNFDTVWMLDAASGYGYPQLKHNLCDIRTEPVRKNINVYQIALENESYTHTGEAIEPAVTVGTLKENVDYCVSYAANIEPGMATVYVQGIGNYKGLVSRQFEIVEEKPSFMKSLAQFMTGPSKSAPSKSVSEDVTETEQEPVEKTMAEAPTLPPALYSKTSTGAYIYISDGCEISLDGVNWQRDNHLTELTPDTSYTVYQRKYETDTTYASECGPSLIFKTKAVGEKLNPPEIIRITDTEIELKPVSGAEYSLDQQNWQDSPLFKELEPMADYFVFQRIKSQPNLEVGEVSVIEASTIRGEGVPNGYTAIRTREDLDAIRYDLNGNYILMNDIDLSGKDWSTIGTNTTPFTGKLNGNGYSIIGMTIEESTNKSENFGLFAKNTGSIRNLGIAGANIHIRMGEYGRVEVGGFAGVNAGIIADCYFTGKIYAQGLEADGCEAGGIAGAGGRIENCYNAGSIKVIQSMNAEVGGISTSGEIKNCYNTGFISAVSGSAQQGGIYATNQNPQNYCLDRVQEAKYRSTSTSSTNRDHSTFVSESEMRKEMTFEGFDFQKHWVIEDGNYPYPQLRNTPHVITEKETPVFADGTGTPYDPYLIETKAQLDAVRNYPDGNFVLQEDLHFIASDYENGSWEPIGKDDANCFFGWFDGNGHTIHGLVVDKESKDVTAAGLFGYQRGTVLQLGFVNGRFHMTANEEGAPAYLGSIAGYNGGLIQRCYNQNDLYGEEPVPVDIDELSVGGIAGTGGKIEDCYNTGAVFVGSSGTGSVTAGGISGGYGTIENCYNTGSVRQKDGTTANASGISPYAGSQNYSSKTAETTTDGPTYLDESELRVQASYPTMDFEQVWIMGDGKDYPYPTLKSVKHAEPKTNTDDFAGGNGTASNPYQIKTREHLENVRYYPSACFVLENNIDMEGDTFTPIGKDEFQSFSGTFDGNGYTIRGLNLDAEEGPYVGLFGYVTGSVKNLVLKDVNIDVSGIGDIEYYAGGLAGQMHLNSRIQNCSVEEINASAKLNSGDLHLGALTGRNEGEIIASGTTGSIWTQLSVIASGSIGGLVGENTGSIHECCSDVDIDADILCSKGAYLNYGGLAGINEGDIVNAFATGELQVYGKEENKGVVRVGGLIGFNYSGKILQHGYFAGSLTATGAERTDPVLNYYYNNVEDVFYLATDETMTSVCGTALREQDMKNKASFIGFDFENVWSLDENAADGYPKLNAVTITDTDGDRRIPIDRAEITHEKELLYDGTVKEPGVTLVYGGEVLITNKDYTVSYTDNIDCGTATIRIAGIGKYQGLSSSEFSILPIEMEPTTIKLSSTSVNYDQRYPVPSVIYGDMTEGKDYVVGYRHISQCGTAEVYVHGIGNYTDVIVLTYEIIPLSIDSMDWTLEYDKTYCTGKAQEPKVVSENLTEDKDYKVSYKNNVAAGVATVTIEGINNYYGKVTKTFTIEHQWDEAYTVDRKADCKNEGEKSRHCAACNAKTDITAIPKTNHVEVKDAAVDATFDTAGKTAGSHCKLCNEVFVAQKTIPKADEIVLSKSSYTYNGKVQKPTVTVKDSRKAVLEPGTDYDLTWSDDSSKNAGTYTVTITLKGDYSGTKTKSYKIAKKKLTSAALSYSSCTYNGKIRKPTVTVKAGTVTLAKKASKSTKSVNITYAKGRKNVGTYKVTVKGTGNYTGTITKSFKINPKGTSISSVTKGSKSLTVKWKKQSGKMSVSRITGYQIRYSTSSSMKNAKLVSVKGYKVTSKKLTKLKASKKYYVQVRTYRLINGTKYYSTWSAKKSMTTR